MFRNLFLSLSLLFFGNSCIMPMIASIRPLSASVFQISGTEKTYTKQYFSNGILKAEGWSLMGIKTAYWKFYNTNGTIASEGNFRTNKKEGYWHFYTTDGALIKEGHYKDNIGVDWWIFHDIATGDKSKFQYELDKKNGFALHYKKGKLKRAEKYKNDIKVGEWTSLWAFKHDNPNASF